MAKKNARAAFLLMLILLMLISAFPLATAETERVFEGPVYDGQSYMLPNGKNFTSYMPNQERIVIDTEEERVSAAKESCQEGRYYKLCFNEFTFSHYNNSQQTREIYKALITLDAQAAKINLTREIPDSIIVGQEYRVKATIHNTGKIDAEKVTFRDNYPRELDVYQETGCELQQNNISWKGRIRPNEKIQCAYTIRGVRSNTILTAATVSYSSGMSDKTESSARILVIEPQPLLMEQLIKPTEAELESEVTVNYTLTAFRDISLDSLIITVPSGLKVTRSDNALRRIGRTLNYKGELKRGETLVFQNRFLAETAGAHNIQAAASYKVKNTPYGTYTGDIKLNGNINVTFKEPYVRFSRTEFPKNSGHIAVFIMNPSNHTFNDIELTLQGLVEGSHHEKELPGISHKEYAHEFSEKPDGEYNTTVRLKYKTRTGQSFFRQTTEQTTINSSTPESTEIRTEPQPGNYTEPQNVDLKKSIDATKNVFLVLAGSLIAVIALGIIAAQYKKGPKARIKELLDEPEAKKEEEKEE